MTVPAQGVPGLSRPPGVGDPGPGRSSGARRMARPGHQASGQRTPAPVKGAGKNIYKSGGERWDQKYQNHGLQF